LDIQNSPDHVPSVKAKKSEAAGCEESHDCHRRKHHRFECARCCARKQEQRSKEMAANVELGQAQPRETQRAIVHDHSYTSKKQLMLPVPLEHPLRGELVMHKEQDQPGHQQLASNGCSEELTDYRCAELSGDVTTTLVIPAEVGKIP